MAYEYYEYLRIERSANDEEIKRAYRKRAMESHPDRHKGDKQKEEEFKKINEAYSVLSDPQKRSHYDQFGSMEWMGGFSGFWGFEWMDGFSWFEDIFENFFSGGTTRGRKKREDRGGDIEVHMRISLEEAVLGTTKTISYTRKNLCEHCHGSGAEKKDAVTKCENCGWSGHVRHRTQTIFWMMEQKGVCHICQWKGSIITEKCHICHGKWTTEETIKKEVIVPAGIESGMSIKLRGEGHKGAGWDGDLYILFDAPNEEANLLREGMDIHVIIKISPAEAVLGTEKKLNLPILGKKNIIIHHGSNHGTIITKKGEWVPSVSRKDEKGNLFFHIEIDVPKKLSNEERALYESLLEHEWGKKEEKSFFEKIFE